MSIVTDKRLSLLVICLMIISAATALPDKILGRNLFYLVIALVVFIVATNLKRNNLQKENNVLAVAFLCVGFSQLFWVYRFPGAVDSIYMADMNYPRTAVYLLLAALLILFLPWLSSGLQLTKKTRFWVTFLAFSGFVYMCARGLSYSFTHPGERLRIDSAATLSAYLCTLQSLFTLYVIRVMGCKYKALLSILLSCLTMLVILLTQTRSALILFPLLLLLFVLINRFWSLKLTAGGCLILGGILFLVVSTSFPGVIDRMHKSYYEITEYSTHNSTSFGSRISMWKAGLYVTTLHPEGQSADTRYHEIDAYMKDYEQGNPEGIRNAVYHLHNDIIESLSLQGLLGGASLLFLFLSLVYFFYKKDVLYLALPLFIAPIVLFGMVDSLFINDRFTVMLCMQLCFFAITADISKRR
ncbi:O-antigen ligase [Mixta theicola]|nr:O-antigen ligase family protein [Mixta theicola]QHM75847.1 O-antigen ligase [Mixta theicola]